MHRYYKDIIIGVVLGALTTVFIATSGCTGSQMRHVNVADGEYYDEDDYLSLTDGEKSRYCAELDSEMSRTTQEFQAKTRELQETKDLIGSTKRKIGPAEAKVLSLESDIRTVSAQIAAVEALPTEYKIKPDDSLTSIAMKLNIYNDIDKWWKIFEANEDKVEDPYYIFPDTVLVIPRDWPTD